MDKRRQVCSELDPDLIKLRIITWTKKLPMRPLINLSLHVFEELSIRKRGCMGLGQQFEEGLLDPDHPTEHISQ